jgi:hypothetical protein
MPSRCDRIATDIVSRMASSRGLGGCVATGHRWRRRATVIRRRAVSGVRRLKRKAELPFEDLPVLARFRDPNVPSTATIVSPNDLAASFGPGVTLKKATVEITDDPITKGIETRLPWLKSEQTY